MKTHGPVIVLAWMVCLTGMDASPAEPVGMEELARLDRLPVLRSAVKVGSVSSYDRTGGNDDGFSGKYSFVRKEGDALVLADIQGPGAIYRIHTPTPTDDMLEIFFDGEERPRVATPFRELFLGKTPGFPRPLVGFGVGGYYCYVPMPFARSCVIRLRAKSLQFYQINYAQFGPETGVTPFQPEATGTELELRNRACEVFASVGTDITRFTAPPQAECRVHSASVTVQPGTAQTVFQTEQPGRIVGLRFSPADALAGKARDLLLRIAFDGQEPAVLCPMGDFFGYAWGKPAMRGLLAGTAGQTAYCYFPMPFDRSATVDVVSERAAPVDLRAEVVYAAVPRSADEGMFYALWRRENPTTIGKPFTFLDTDGRGHLVGLVLQSQGFVSGETPFFEGDDQSTIDGELTIPGTGSEDFLNGGWYDVPDRWEKRLSLPMSGCLDYAKPLGRTGGYRFFVGDAVAFRKHLLQTIEHGGEGNSIPTDYCGTTYFYCRQRPTADLAPPPLAQRAVSDPKEILFPAGWQTPIHAWSFGNASLTRKQQRIGEENVRSLSLATTGHDWFGPHFLSPTVDLPATGRYAVSIEAVRGPAQGIVQLFQNENPAGDGVDLYAPEPAKTERILLGTLDLEEGANHLMLKLVGQNPESTGLGLDLIAVICVREE